VHYWPSTGAEPHDQALAARRREATTLDRVHAAMLLQAGGRPNALRNLLKAEQERSPDFLRLANALSALYPKESEETRYPGDYDPISLTEAREAVRLARRVRTAIRKMLPRDAAGKGKP